MKKLLFVIPLLFFLAACNQPQIVRVNTNVAITIPSEYFNDAACPQIKDFPDPNKYTERQIADLILKLVKSNRMCYNTIMKIKVYLEQHNKIISK